MKSVLHTVQEPRLERKESRGISPGERGRESERARARGQTRFSAVYVDPKKEGNWGNGSFDNGAKLIGDMLNPGGYRTYNN